MSCSQQCREKVAAIGWTRAALLAVWLIVAIVAIVANFGFSFTIATFGLPFLCCLIFFPWARLVRDPFMPEATFMCTCTEFKAKQGRGVTVSKYCYLLLVAVALSSMVAQRELLRAEPNAYVVASTNLFGMLAVLLSSCFFADVLLFIAIAVSFCARKPFVRRSVWSKVRCSICVAMFIGLSANSLYEGYRMPKVVEVDLPVPNLPVCLDGFRLVMTSDVHVGPLVGTGLMRQMVDQVNSLNPDAVVLVGDFTDGKVDVLGVNLEPLRGLQANGGVYFVTGNHEQIHGDAAKWVELIGDLDVTTLENRRAVVALTPGDSGPVPPTPEIECSLDLVGVSDWTLQPDMAAAMEGRDFNRACVLLSHQPKEEIIEQALGYDVGLILSGHTHGGQTWPLHLFTYLNLPNSFAGLMRRSGRGGVQEQDMWVFVSEGYVGWGPRVRFGSHSEVNVLVLRSPEAAGVNLLVPDTSPAYSLRLAHLAIASVVMISLWLCLVYGHAYAQQHSPSRYEGHWYGRCYACCSCSCCLRIPLITPLTAFARAVYADDLKAQKRLLDSQRDCSACMSCSAEERAIDSSDVTAAFVPSLNGTTSEQEDTQHIVGTDEYSRTPTEVL